MTLHSHTIVQSLNLSFTYYINKYSVHVKNLLRKEKISRWQQRWSMDGRTQNKFTLVTCCHKRFQITKTHLYINSFCNSKYYQHRNKLPSMKQDIKNLFLRQSLKRILIYVTRPSTQSHAHRFRTLTIHMLHWGCRMEQLPYTVQILWHYNIQQKSIHPKSLSYSFSKMVGKWFQEVKMDKFTSVMLCKWNHRWKGLTCLSPKRKFLLWISRWMETLVLRM